MGALELPFWQAFCRGVACDDLVGAQFDASIVDGVAAIIAARTSMDWLTRFEPDACMALVRLPAEAMTDAHVRSHAMTDPAAGPAPVLGADTDDVLAESCIDPTCVQRLTRSGVLAGRQSSERAARADRLGAMLVRKGEVGAAPLS